MKRNKLWLRTFISILLVILLIATNIPSLYAANDDDETTSDTTEISATETDGEAEPGAAVGSDDVSSPTDAEQPGDATNSGAPKIIADHPAGEGDPVTVSMNVPHTAETVGSDDAPPPDLEVDLNIRVNIDGVTGFTIYIPLEAPHGVQYFHYDPDPANCPGARTDIIESISYNDGCVLITLLDNLPQGTEETLGFCFYFDQQYSESVESGTVLWDSVDVTVTTALPAFSVTLSSVSVLADVDMSHLGTGLLRVAGLPVSEGDDPVSVSMYVPVAVNISASDETPVPDLKINLGVSIDTSDIKGFSIQIPLEAPHGIQYYHFDENLSASDLPDIVDKIEYNNAIVTLTMKDDIPVGTNENIVLAFAFDQSYRQTVLPGTVVWDSVNVIVTADEPLFSETLSSATVVVGSDTPSQTANIHLKWFPDGFDSLVLTPKYNNQNSATMQLDLSLGSKSDVKAGDVEVRLPYTIFAKRDGTQLSESDQSHFDIPLLKQSEVDDGMSNDMSYCYYIDTAKKEIVLTNYKDITSSALTFSCTISYNYTPYLIANGFTNNDIHAELYTGSTHEKEAVSNSLNMSVKTGAVILGTLQKTLVSKYEEWDTSWGTAPADAADYFYVVWQVQHKSNQQCTQPYTLGFTSNSEQGTVIRAGSTASKLLAVPASGTNFTMTYSNPSSLAQTNLAYFLEKFPRTALQTATSFVSRTAVVLAGSDGAADSTEVSAQYNYTSVSFEYPGDVFSVDKGSTESNKANSSNSGVVDRVLSGNPGKVASDLLVNSFSLSADARGWGLTNGGTDKYTVDLIDEQVVLDKVTLSPQDYELTSFYLKYTEYNYKTDANLGYVDVEATDYNNYQQVGVFVKTLSNPNWAQIGTVKKTSSSNYVFTDNGGASRAIDSRNSVPLPAGTYAFKCSHEGSRYRVVMNAYVDMNINPTDYVISRFSEAATLSFTLYNIGTLNVKGKDGAVANKGSVSAVSSAIQTLVTNFAKSNYGQTLTHKSTYYTLRRLAANDSVSYSCSVDSNDAVNQQISLSFISNAYETVNIAAQTTTTEEAAAALIEQRSGTFYVLLPPGMTAVASSVKVTTINTLYGCDGIPCNFSTEFVNDWQSSGRTMMLVRVRVPDTVASNIKLTTSSSAASVLSGFALSYNAVYPWQSYKVYGGTLDNSIAYRSDQGFKGSNSYSHVADYQGIGVAEKANKVYFLALDNDETVNKDIKTLGFGFISKGVTANTAAETGFSMKVKAADDAVYGDAAEVPAFGTYSYRLSFGNGPSTTASGLVFYDILEAYDSGGSQWKGTLGSIDLSFVKSKGIEPVVYYSTVSIPDTYKEADNDLLSYRDLTNKAYWSTTPPQDLSRVSAIAVDISRKTDGSNYTISNNEVLLCILNMRAPMNYEDYESLYAWNRAYYTVTEIPASGIADTLTQECNYTRVSLRQPDISISMSANPASGTEDAPAVIAQGADLEYTITAENVNTYETVKNIEVTGLLPQGYTIDFANTKCYFGDNPSDAKPVSEVSRVSAARSGSKLTFAIDKLTSGEKLNIVITGTASGGGETTLNTEAVVTKINDDAIDLVSNSMWHKIPKSHPAAVVFDGTEVLSGTNLAGNMFRYTVNDSSGVTVAAGANNEDGTIGFDTFYVDSVGAYQYTVTENDDGLDGVTYDESMFTVTVTVTEAGGALSASVDYSSGVIRFNNIYVDPTPAEPADPEDPTDPTEPVDPEDSADPTEPVDPEDLADPTEPVDPQDSADPTKPADPEDSTDPTKPADPEDSTDPTKPSEPVNSDRGEDNPPSAQTPEYPYIVEFYKDDDNPAHLLAAMRGITEFPEEHLLTESDITRDLGVGWITAKEPRDYDTDAEVYAVITEDAVNNIVKVIYKKLSVYPYRVDYYKDSVSSRNKLSSVVGSSTFKGGHSLTAADLNSDFGDDWLDKYVPSGYGHGVVQGGFPIISAGDNVINVLYTAALDGGEELYTYTIEYYEDTISQESMIGSPVSVGARYKAGYHLKKTDLTRDAGSNWLDARRPEAYDAGVVEGELPLIAADSNIVRIVYKKSPSYGYTVEYYTDDTSAGNKIAATDGKTEHTEGHTLNAVNLADELGSDWVNHYRPNGYGNGVPESYPIIGSSNNVVKIVYSPVDAASMDTLSGNKTNPKTGDNSMNIMLRLMISCCILAALALIWKVEIQGRIKNI